MMGPIDTAGWLAPRMAEGISDFASGYAWCAMNLVSDKYPSAPHVGVISGPSFLKMGRMSHGEVVEHLALAGRIIGAHCLSFPPCPVGVQRN